MAAATNVAPKMRSAIAPAMRPVRMLRCASRLSMKRLLADRGRMTPVTDGPFLGIDVGGTKVEVAAVEGARALDPVESPTELATPDALLNGIEALTRQVIEAKGVPAAIGVGVPSQIDFATGTVVSSVNIPLHGVPLRDELQRRFD